MKLLLFVVLGLLFLCTPAEACMKGGITPRATGALIALCVVFSPVLIAGGIGYGVVKGTAKGVYKLKEVKQNADQRRRTSNLIKKQRNRMIKKIGNQKFQEYVQQLYDRCVQHPTNENLLELGTALFLNNDLRGSDEWLTKAISNSNDEWAKRGTAYFVRGVVHQYLSDYQGAIDDFGAAAKHMTAVPPTAIANEDATANKLPVLTVHDAINALGYVKMQLALYGNIADPFGEALQDDKKTSLLEEAIADITKAIEGTPEPQGMYFHNRGFARYFKTNNLRSDRLLNLDELRLAMADFDFAIQSTNFGTTAEGIAMKAQCLARLGMIEEAKREAERAKAADPKVFLVDLDDETQLICPWPLPRDKYRHQESAHQFVEKKFHRPHFCDHCSSLIKVGVGYHCWACDYKVHKSCFPRVKGKDCWVGITNSRAEMNGADTIVEERTEEEGEEMRGGPDPLAHTHKLKATHFHKPTWCDLCAGFIASPVGKQGYRCTDCRLQIHKSCTDLAGTHFII